MGAEISNDNSVKSFTQKQSAAKPRTAQWVREAPARKSKFDQLQTPRSDREGLLAKVGSVIKAGAEFVADTAEHLACDTPVRAVAPALAGTTTGIVASTTGPGAIVAGSLVSGATEAGLQKLCGEEMDLKKVGSQTVGLAASAAAVKVGVHAVGMGKILPGMAKGSASSGAYNASQQIINEGKLDVMELSNSMAAGTLAAVGGVSGSSLLGKTLDKVLPESAEAKSKMLDATSEIVATSLKKIPQV